LPAHPLYSLRASYVKSPKPAQPPELLAAVSLLAREELGQFGARAGPGAARPVWRWLTCVCARAERALRNMDVDIDVGDLRALLRAGPFRKFRDAMRSIARLLPDSLTAKGDAEACFARLEALDMVLVELLSKAEDKAAAAALRAEAAAQVSLAVTSLDALLAQLPTETLDAARAALA
jgi:hypothetical protein